MSVAQRLIFGIEKPYLDNSIRDFLSRYQPGGVILFDRNGESLVQLKVLIEDIKATLKAKPFIAIDFEGGRVRRNGALFSRLEQASAYLEKGFELLKNDAARVATEFSEVGINLNFAPVADLKYEPLNAALDKRTCSADSAIVADYCLNFMGGFKSAGILCCLKHFPGLGSAVNDPHQQISISCISSERYLANDLIPFKAGIDFGVKFIMTTHVIMAPIDQEIATFSQQVTKLARLAGFEYIIITDDMSMGAIRGQAELPDNILKALCAGHDMALICHDIDRHESIIEYLEKNLKRLEAHGHKEALKRISHVKKQLP